MRVPLWCAALSATLATGAVAQEAGQWFDQTKKSELTDETTVMWVLVGSNTIPNSIGMKQTPGFMVGCLANETRVGVDLQNFMGTEIVKVSYRLDRGEVRHTIGVPATDGSIVIITGGNAIAMLKAMQGKTKLVVAAAPWGSGNVEGVFDVTAAAKAIATVRAACSW